MRATPKERMQRPGPRTVYVTAIEDIVQSPLIRGQVFNLLREMRDQEPERLFAVFALYPVLNFWRFRRKTAALRAELAQDGIGLHVAPILFLTRYFYIPWWLAPLYFLQALIAACWIGWRLRPTLVHCRSYPAAMVGWLVRRIWRTPFVFDTRAPYPEEGAVREIGARTQRLDEPSFRMWKRWEGTLVKAAAFTTTVSTPNYSYLVGTYPAQVLHLCVAPTFAFVPDQQKLIKWRAETRQQINTNNAVLAYAGSWSEPNLLRDVFQRVQAATPTVTWSILLLVAQRGAPAQIPDLNDYFQTALGTRNCTALSAAPNQVARYLAGADLAVFPLQPSDAFRHDPRYALWSKTVISVKFVEYLAAGLPVLVSQWAGAAAELVNTYDVGIVYDTITDAALAAWLLRWQQDARSFRVRAWETAHTHFSHDVVAHQYLELYRQAKG